MSKKILTVLLIIAIATLGYFILQNQKLLSKLTQQENPSRQTPQASTSPNVQASFSPETSPSPVISKSITENAIKTNVNAKNLDGLKPYLASSPHVILQASECCGQRTPDQTIKDMEYINDGIPFNFNQQDQNIQNIKTKNAQLANDFMGVSTTKEHLVSFTINSEGKITKVLMAVTWKLFDM